MGLPWIAHRAGPEREDRIEAEKTIERELNFSTAQRAENLVRRCVEEGTTAMRCHIDVDPEIRLKRLEGMLAVREKFRERVAIEIVAFPQSGVIRAPGTLEFLDEAVKMGADLIGGIDPQVIDGDLSGQLRGIFAIAEKRGVGIDIHLHEPGEIGIVSIRRICEKTKAFGLNGKVTVSHGFCLGMINESIAKETASIMAETGVSLVTNGAGASAIPPILILRKAGVDVFAGNDNIRDSWSPFTTVDMLERAMLISWRSDFRRDDQLMVAYEMIISAPGCLYGKDRKLIEIGFPADVCFVDTECIPEAIVLHPRRKFVVKHGRIVAKDGVFLKNAIIDGSP
jgi:cytosine deaminase